MLVACRHAHITSWTDVIVTRLPPEPNGHVLVFRVEGKSKWKFSRSAAAWKLPECPASAATHAT